MVRTGGSRSMMGVWSSRRRPRRIGLFHGLRFIAGAQNRLDDIGPIEPFPEPRGGEEVGLLVPAPVDVPADQVLGTGRGHVIAGRRPGHPALGRHVDEEREQFLAVRPAVPADRAVVVGRNHDGAVLAEVHARSRGLDGMLPALPAVRVEGAQPIFGAEHEARPVAADRDRAGHLEMFEGDRLAAELRRQIILPVGHREPADIRWAEASRHRRCVGELAGREVENDRAQPSVSESGNGLFARLPRP